MITLTNAALTKIKEILADEPESSKLRTFVQGGGCSGMSYGFTIDTEQNEDDFVVEGSQNLVLVDSMSVQYLQNAVIDYVDDLMGSSFRIDNPNAETTCGCGSSFSVADDFLDDVHDFDNFG
jgi:iron-sulfur cluster assembly accessory protein